MPARITLIATTGPLAGRQFRFEGRTVCTVGRSHDCLLQLPSKAGDLTASRRHCEIIVEPPEVTVRDLGSTNGTYLNGAAVGRQRPGQLLHDGDSLRVGNSIFRVTVEEMATCGTAMAT